MSRTRITKRAFVEKWWDEVLKHRQQFRYTRPNLQVYGGEWPGVPWKSIVSSEDLTEEFLAHARSKYPAGLFNDMNKVGFMTIFNMVAGDCITYVVRRINGQKKRLIKFKDYDQCLDIKSHQGLDRAVGE